MVSKKMLIVLLVFCFGVAFSQTTIKGSVFNEYLEPVSGAVVEYNNQKVTTDFDGVFEIKRITFPLNIVVKKVGYKTEKIKISEQKVVNVVLKESITLDEIVVSASRTPERIFEAPVTIERFNIKSIKRNTAASFYEGLQNLRGVDVSTNSSVYRIVNTRSFATLQNTRFVQLYDGADNVMPSNSTSLGSMFGISDLDVESVEVLQGSASALYGANAFNGIMLVKSKNPFQYPGVSVEMKSGFTKQKAGGTKPFYNPNVRLAVKLSDKVALKGNFSYYTGEEWHATDYRNISAIGGKVIGGTRETNPDYNGVNIYGDDLVVPLPLNLVVEKKDDKQGRDLRLINLTRTGYKEYELLDNYQAKNIAYDGALYYRPFGNEKLQLILSTKVSKGTNILQLPPARYQQKDRVFNQHKVEVSGDFFTVRGYYSKVNSGNSYQLGNLADGIQNSWKDVFKWHEEADKFTLDGNNMANPIPYGEENIRKKMAEVFQVIEKGKPLFGTQGFEKAKGNLLSKEVKDGGAKEVDNSRLYHFDVNLDLKQYVSWVHLQMGSSFRRYVLDSGGNIFADENAPIIYDESGVYMQARRKFANDRLSISFSGRYDKSKNFKGEFTPRFALSYLAGKDKTHFLRFAYQTAFRNPTPQDQYRRYLSGHIAIGTAEDNLGRKENRYFISHLGEEVSAKDVINNSFSYKSVQEFKKTEGYKAYLEEKGDYWGVISKQYGVLKPAVFEPVKPEEVASFELGYRGMYNISNKILELDLSGFYSTYSNFITQRSMIYATGGKVDFSDFKKGRVDDIPRAVIGLVYSDMNNIYSFTTNSKSKITSYGASLSLKSKVFNGYDLGFSYDWTGYNYDKKVDPNFKPGFNSPEHSVKFQFGHSKLFKNFGFNSALRWQSAFLWQSPYLEGTIDSRVLLDAQINYTIPQIRSRIKIGGSNLLGKEYFGALGSGLIGSSYYLSWVIND